MGLGRNLGPPREVTFVQSAPKKGLGGSVTCVSLALATPCDCRREHTEWDKLFIMLEDSQMREGMLLQATDDVLRGELQRLRAELGRLAGSLGRPCAPPAPAEAWLDRALDELLQASRDAGRRLARLESAGMPRPEEAGRALGAVLEELRRTRADLRAVQGWAAGRWLPAGKDAGRSGSHSPRPRLPPLPTAPTHPASLSWERAWREAWWRSSRGSFNGDTHTSVSPCTLTGLRNTVQGAKIGFKKYSPAPGNREESYGHRHHSLEIDVRGP